jgi:hypothetical protein
LAIDQLSIPAVSAAEAQPMFWDTKLHHHRLSGITSRKKASSVSKKMLEALVSAAQVSGVKNARPHGQQPAGGHSFKNPRHGFCMTFFSERYYEEGEKRDDIDHTTRQRQKFCPFFDQKCCLKSRDSILDSMASAFPQLSLF